MRSSDETEVCLPRGAPVGVEGVRKFPHAQILGPGTPFAAVAVGENERPAVMHGVAPELLDEERDARITRRFYIATLLASRSQ